MYKRGIGCEANASEAFAWYAKAFELSGKEQPSVWESATFRLGDAYEHGFDCEQSFEKALQYCQQAEIELDIAVRSEDYFYKRVLANVRSAIKRIEQEIDGRY